MEEEKKYNVDVSDPKVLAVLNEGNAAMDELKTNVETMTKDANDAYNTAKTELDTLAKEQAANQKEATGIAVKKLETEKENAKKDYVKEQSGAYADYQVQTQKHGVNAEQMASMGMGGTGYSESAKVSMYNAYQNRVAVAREAFTRASAEYDVAIEEAKLQGSVALAEIAMNAYKEKTALALEQMQYGNSLLNTLTEQKASISKDYWQRYLDVMSSSVSDQYNLDDDDEKNDDKKKVSYGNAWNNLKTAISNLQNGLPAAANNIFANAEADIVAKAKASNSVDEENISNVLSSLGISDINAITAKEFNKLIEDGIVEEYKENGKYKYRLTANGEKAYKNKLTSQNNRDEDGKRK